MMNHSLGRTSLEYWTHKHFQFFGKYPTVLQYFRKTYMHDDPTQSSDASSQTDLTGGYEQSRAVSSNPEAWRILEELNNAYGEAIEKGLEEDEANESALSLVLGDTSSRLHAVITKNTEGSKRKHNAIKECDFDGLKEKLENEKMQREKLEAQLRLQEAKMQRLISHLGFSALMASSSSNDESSDRHTLVSDQSVQDARWLYLCLFVHLIRALYV